MALIDFVKEAGKQMGITRDEPSQEKLMQEIEALGLGVSDLGVEFKDGVVQVSGSTVSQEEREKVILALGNVEGVEQVDDYLEVESTEPPIENFYTVQRGDTLSKISKQFYGDAMKYMVIFDANTPMLKDPDKIYPGQVLRIPELY
jgi:nucleoid-associated protein YgaU